MQKAISETRGLLTKLEFAAMECVDQNAEKSLTETLIAIKQQTESAAIAFDVI
jgi:hypothetical protein